MNPALATDSRCLENASEVVLAGCIVICKAPAVYFGG
jgi:hypothetical protein